MELLTATAFHSRRRHRALDAMTAVPRQEDDFRILLCGTCACGCAAPCQGWARRQFALVGGDDLHRASATVVVMSELDGDQ